MSKGSNRRPQQVPDDVAGENWRRIFNKTPAEPGPQPKEQDDGERIPGPEGHR